MAKIHSTASVHPKAALADDVTVGAYAVIDAEVRIGDGTIVGHHAVITGQTEIGKNNVIGIGAVIGLEPQDLSYKGAKSYVKIGDHNTLREYVQVHRGTKEDSSTVIGDHNFLMGFSHVAHNCQLGNHIIFANGVLLAGYAQIEDYVFLSGHCLVHQFCRIGKYSMMRGGAKMSQDLPPYCISDEMNLMRGLNVVGLQRNGFSVEQIRGIKNLYQHLFSDFSGVSGAEPLQEKISKMLTTETRPEIRYFLEFILNSKRGICRP